MKQGRRLQEDHEDPLSGVANLFDIGIVFALGFIVSLVAYLGLPEVLGESDFTLVKNPGQANMEVLIRKGRKLEHVRATGARIRGAAGKKLGTAWRLEDGKMVYVPE